MRILAILTVRNEGAFLLEWLAHHRAAGITDFVVASNDCTDGTDAMLDRLEALGWLTHLRNDGPYGKRGIQFTALDLAADTASLRQADWLLSLDIDEFVNVHVGRRTVPCLLAALPGADAITLTWRVFGNGGVVRYRDRPVTCSFTRAAPATLFGPWRAAMFKTLYRNDGLYRRPGVHRPRDPDPERVGQARWVDGCGRTLGDAFRTRRVFSDFGRANHDLVQLNHYPLGAMESFVLKADRGRAVHGSDRLGLDYWVERNFDAERDDSVTRLDSSGLRADLHADPVLGPLHRRAVAWRHDRFRALMRDEACRALFSRLLMTPPSRPIGRRAAHMLAGWATASTLSP